MSETTIDMEYRLLKNFIYHMPQIYRKRNANWFIVQTFLQRGTREGGSASSRGKCRALGIDPDGYTLERKVRE